MLLLHFCYTDRQDMESLSHVTAQHDFNWARAAPQVATWVSVARAAQWGSLAPTGETWASAGTERSLFSVSLKWRNTRHLVSAAELQVWPYYKRLQGTGHRDRNTTWKRGPAMVLKGKPNSLCFVLLPSFSPPRFFISAPQDTNRLDHLLLLATAPWQENVIGRQGR